MAAPASPWELHLRGMGDDAHGGCSCLEAVLAAARQRGAPLARLTALGVNLGRQGEQRQVEELASALKGGALFPAMRKLTLQVDLSLARAPWRIELEREAARRSVHVEWLHTDLLAAAMAGDARSLSTLLLEAGCDKEKAREDGATPAIIAAQEGHADCLRLLLKAGCDKDKADDNGWTPASIAALNGHADCLRLLLEAGCDKDKANEEGTTPAVIAAQEGHADCLRLLLEAGCDKDKAKQNDATPAFMAAKYGHADCLRLLLEAGCDKDKACEDGATPATIAARKGHADCVRLLE